MSMTAGNTTPPNATAVARYVAAARGRNFPNEVVDAARMALVDSIGVALGAHDEPAGETVRRTAARWATRGGAQVILGGTAAPGAAALVNATLGHCLDYDDTHVGSVGHLSNPTWAAALAVGADCGANQRAILAAYIAGFEVASRLGNGLGHAANKRGFHSTGLFGCFGAAVAAAVLLGLDEDGIARALGAAATQTSGLTGSFGTMAKPFHAGKAAMNGILAAELAAEGFEPARDLVEADGALVAAVVQDGSFTMRALDFEDGWELTRNTFKPYASCLLTHPVIDAARKAGRERGGREVEAVEIEVTPACIQLAGKPAPKTGLEGKFSTAYCAALGLFGHAASKPDFADARVRDPQLADIVAKVVLRPVEDMDMRSARLALRLADGSIVTAATEMALGNPGNPMSWGDMEAKFRPCVEPVLGGRTDELLSALKSFGDGGSLKEINALIGGT